MLVSAYEARQTARHFGLGTDAEQLQRIARGYSLVQRSLVTLEQEMRDYNVWCVDSQYNRGVY